LTAIFLSFSLQLSDRHFLDLLLLYLSRFLVVAESENPRTPPWKMNRIISTSSSKLRHFRRQATAKTEDDDDRHRSRHILWHYQILDPDSDIVTHWNHVFLIASLIALFIDPLYFYLPSTGGPACLSADNRLVIAVTLLRSVTDLFYLLHMIMKFRTAFVAPTSRVFGRGELVMDGREIAMRYLKSDFIVDFAAMLPVPQACPTLILSSYNKQ
jgi:cyclic nucleotide gated channel